MLDICHECCKCRFIFFLLDLPTANDLNSQIAAAVVFSNSRFLSRLSQSIADAVAKSSFERFTVFSVFSDGLNSFKFSVLHVSLIAFELDYWCAWYRC